MAYRASRGSWQIVAPSNIRVSLLVKRRAFLRRLMSARVVNEEGEPARATKRKRPA